MDNTPAARFRLKPWPILATVTIGFGVLYLAAYVAKLAIWLLHLRVTPGANLPWLYLQHGCQLLVALVCIAILKRRLVPADYGLHWPHGRTYLGPAILWGMFFGLLMTLIDFAPQLAAHAMPATELPLTHANLWGWIAFSGLYVGPTEEIPFRALLVTFLATTMPGKLRVAGRFEMNGAGVVVALIFALAHVSSFFVEPWPLALGQQLYAFALGVLYAYWLEKSKSIVAPAIGHNVSDVTEILLQAAWLGLF